MSLCSDASAKMGPMTRAKGHGTRQCLDATSFVREDNYLSVADVASGNTVCSACSCWCGRKLQNTADRCYFCKSTLSRLAQVDNIMYRWKECAPHLAHAVLNDLKKAWDVFEDIPVMRALCVCFDSPSDLACVIDNATQIAGFACGDVVGKAMDILGAVSSSAQHEASASAVRTNSHRKLATSLRQESGNGAKQDGSETLCRSYVEYFTERLSSICAAQPRTPTELKDFMSSAQKEFRNIIKQQLQGSIYLEEERQITLRQRIMYCYLADLPLGFWFGTSPTEVEDLFE